MTSHPSLSERGARLASSQLRIDLDMLMESLGDLYHPTEHPAGVLAMNIAENNLNWRSLKQRLTELAQSPPPDWISNYTSTAGELGVRREIARFIQRNIAEVSIDPDSLILTSGATASVELSALALASRGDSAVIPAPAYPVYRPDLFNKAGVIRHDLRLAEEPSTDGLSALDCHDLDRCHAELAATSHPMRMLILTQPDNPTGLLYRQEQLDAIAQWCIDHRVHLLVNELYALSLIDTRHPQIRSDYQQQQAFESVLPIIARRQSDYLHWWYSFSKDLGISGFRMGLIHTRNRSFIDALKIINAPHQVSNHSQWLLGQLLADQAFLDDWLIRSRQALSAAYARVVSMLKGLNIPYAPARGSLFVWCRLDRCMTDETPEAELLAWRKLHREAGIILTPGQGFGHPQSGWFRIVISGVCDQGLEAFCRRFRSWVLRQPRS